MDATCFQILNSPLVMTMVVMRTCDEEQGDSWSSQSASFARKAARRTAGKTARRLAHCTARWAHTGVARDPGSTPPPYVGIPATVTVLSRSGDCVDS